MILRRAALMAAGLAMAGSAGLVGASTASAATNTGLVGASAASAATNAGLLGTYTLEVTGGGCEVISASNGSFTADAFGDSGITAGGGNAKVGGASVALYWTAGGDTGLLFSGAKVSSTTWKGNFGGFGAGLKGKLVKGAVSGC
jgi:ribonuclease E